ncbi:hypothetical protein D3C84_823610 [compost metagenome]
MNLRLMQQQLASACRVRRVVPVPLLERADVHVVDEHLTVTNRCERIVDIGSAVADRLDLRTGQHDARFIRFLDEIVMRCFLILCQRLRLLLLLRHPIHLLLV